MFATLTSCSVGMVGTAKLFGKVLHAVRQGLGVVENISVWIRLNKTVVPRVCPGEVKGELEVLKARGRGDGAVRAGPRGRRRRRLLAGHAQGGQKWRSGKWTESGVPWDAQSAAKEKAVGCGICRGAVGGRRDGGASECRCVPSSWDDSINEGWQKMTILFPSPHGPGCLTKGEEEGSGARWEKGKRRVGECATLALQSLMRACDPRHVPAPP
jgi:hypothetical protein